MKLNDRSAFISHALIDRELRGIDPFHWFILTIISELYGIPLS